VLEGSMNEQWVGRIATVLVWVGVALSLLTIISIALLIFGSSKNLGESVVTTLTSGGFAFICLLIGIYARRVVVRRGDDSTDESLRLP
jgi:Kef-type K+ transport system membrane component KefB